MFWSDLTCFGHNVAVVDGNTRLTYAELAEHCDALQKQLGDIKSLVFVMASNDINGLIAYLACLRANKVCMLIDPELAQSKLDTLLTTYQPNFVIHNLQVKIYSSAEHVFAEQLALLLSTSGTTGSAKQVALSFDNIQNNADAICGYLPIHQSDKTLSTLPLFYSYGLSVINTHLNRGATIVFTAYSMMNREFWKIFETEQINSFAAVPHNYDMLLRIKFTEMALSSLRYFTQAGGRLAEKKVATLANYAQRTGKQFFVMYGQTEATARMSYLSPEQAILHPDSIGKPVPYGRFELRDPAGNRVTKVGEVGEIIYSGPNVMLGYANSSEDLQQFSPSGKLATGDLGYADKEGLYYIVGRKKRMVKLFGNRVNLDEVEQFFHRQGIEVTSAGTDKKLVVAFLNEPDISSLKKELSQYLNIHSSAIVALSLSEFPLTANGKKDYRAILSKAGMPDD